MAYFFNREVICRLILSILLPYATLSLAQAQNLTPSTDINRTTTTELERVPRNTASNIIFQQDFNVSPIGTIDRTLLGSLFNSPTWNNGVDEGRVAIVDGSSVERGRVLEVKFPNDTYGPDDGGAQWKVQYFGDHDELYLAYWVRFGEGFDFVWGGKLPGLVGGAANSGGSIPNGTDGWSARMMWRISGKVVQYVYHPDQEGPNGEDMDWNIGANGQRYFIPDQWHRVVHRIVMNTPGEHDGIIEGWFDGELALRRDNLRFRNEDTFAIDAIYFSTFFGGGSAGWASNADETILFDDFMVWTASSSSGLEVTHGSDFSATGSAGGPFSPASSTFTLRNTGGASINWSTSENAPWASVSPSQGTLDGGDEVTLTLSLDSAATTLSAGDYSATLQFLNDDAPNEVLERSLSLSITPPVVNEGLSISPTASFFMGSQGGPYGPGMTYVVINESDSDIPVTVSAEPDWLSVISPTPTVLPPDGLLTFEVRINSNANTLTPGGYSGTVMINNQSLSVSLQIVPFNDSDLIFGHGFE